MITPDRRCASAARRPQQRALLIGALLSMLLSASGGCQERRGPLPEPARILFDSLVAANEAMYDTVGPNLGYHRMGCVYERVVSKLGRELAERLSIQAEDAVRSRHSRTELEVVNRGLQGNHPFPTPEVCVGIDSLWYARIITKPPARP